MGLKSGSRDAGLDDGEADERSADERADEGERSDDGVPADDPGGADGAHPTDAIDASGASEAESDAGTGAESAEGSGGAGRPTVQSLPYTLRREKVNEGRSQVPFFLREAVVEGEADLQDALESALGEEVYKSDYREAAMVVAQRNPELVAEVLREWGYDLDPV